MSAAAFVASIEYPIYDAPPGDYRVVGANAQPPGLRVGDRVRLVERDGRPYRVNLKSGEEVPLLFSDPCVWVVPLERS